MRRSGNVFIRIACASAALALSTTVVHASCEPRWTEQFGALPAIAGPVNAMALFDAGDGEALYVGGSFASAGGVPARNIAKWTGSMWKPLGAGIESSGFASVEVLSVFDDGSGPALYAGGTFTHAGGEEAAHIARWNGSSWAPVGGGFPAGTTIYAMVAHDDGSGPALYVGGRFFATADGTAAWGIARWDGNAWSAVGGGLNDAVRALTVLDDGSGAVLYAGGEFNQAEGRSAKFIAKWDGNVWSPLGGGVSSAVRALSVFDDGSGGALYAGGEFGGAEGVPMARIARWDGAAWSPLGAGLNQFVFALHVFDDGGGPALYAGGQFTAAGGAPASYIARWDGAAWASVGGGVNNIVYALASAETADGPAIFAGGLFTTAGDEVAGRVGEWRGCVLCAGAADLNCDGSVDLLDLLALLAAWGPCAPEGSCPADITADGAVDVADLLALLAAWG